MAHPLIEKYRERKEEVSRQLLSYLKKKKKLQRESEESKKEEEGDEEEEDNCQQQRERKDKGGKEKEKVEFVHKMLSNREKMHFSSLVEIVRLDFREELLRLTAPEQQLGEEEDGGNNTHEDSDNHECNISNKNKAKEKFDESFFQECSSIETDLTELLTSIGSLSHHASSSSSFIRIADDLLRIFAAWMIFCTAALLLPLPFFFLKSLRKVLRVDVYSPLAHCCTKFMCHWVMSVSALVVELHDERSPRGKELMKKHRSVTCFNHASTIDAFIVPSITSTFTYFLGKKELFALPFFSWLVAALGGIPIDRKNRESAVASLQLAADSVKPGEGVAISPEGTRSLTGLLLPFKKGPFYLWEAMQEAGKADGCECLVQPVMLIGAYELFPPTSLLTLPGVVQVHMLEPISPSELPSSCHQRDAMSALLRRRLLQAYQLPATPELASSRRELTAAERASSVGTLLGTLLGTGVFFGRLWALGKGCGLSGRQLLGWALALSSGVTAALYGFYNWRLRRAVPRKKMKKKTA